MELAPHDLLHIRHPHDLLHQTEQPAWVQATLEQAPYVVVRRARATTGFVAVGIRGQIRSERHAASLPLYAITKCITPEQLAQAQEWKTSPHLSSSPALQALASASNILRELDLTWGPVGSVGFELASKIPTTTRTSDLDLIIRVSKRLPLSLGQALSARLTTIPIHIDIQVETPYGAFALAEYVREATSLVLRTIDGPKLVYNPWDRF